MVDYSNKLSDKAWNHSKEVRELVNVALGGVVSAVIWAAALIVTPLVWAVDKVASKFSDARSEAVDLNAIPEK